MPGQPRKICSLVRQMLIQLNAERGGFVSNACYNFCYKRQRPKKSPVNWTKHTDSTLLRWLLIVAVVFAPLQGALSMPGHVCHVDQSVTKVEPSCHHSQTGAADNPASLEDPWCKDCANGNCGGACGFFHITFSLPAFAQFVFSETHFVMQPQVSDQQTGRVTSPPLRPPKR